MFVAMILICGLPEGNMGCVAIVDNTPLNTEIECAEHIMRSAPVISENLAFGAFIADWGCTQMSVAG